MSNLSIEERRGAVILTLEDHYAILTPDQANLIAEDMARKAHMAKTGQTPYSKSVIAERLQNRLVTRLSLVIKSLQEKNKPPLYIANEVVHIVLSEAL